MKLTIFTTATILLIIWIINQLLLRNSAPLFNVPKSQAGANSRITADHRSYVQKRKDDYCYVIILNSNTWTRPYCTRSALGLNPSHYRTNWSDYVTYYPVSSACIRTSLSSEGCQCPQELNWGSVRSATAVDQIRWHSETCVAQLLTSISSSAWTKTMQFIRGCQ